MLWSSVSLLPGLCAFESEAPKQSGCQGTAGKAGYGGTGSASPRGGENLWMQAYRKLPSWVPTQVGHVGLSGGWPEPRPL